MGGKGLGWLLAIVGVVLVAAGLVVMLVVVPGMKQLPADTDTTRTYEGTMATLLDPTTFKTTTDLPIELERRFFVAATTDGLALVTEERAMTSGGQPLQQGVNNYSVDRVTMEWSDDYPAEWAENEGFWPREGYVIGWPMDTEQKDYTGWSDDYLSTVPLTFVEEATHERSGMTLYKFTSASDPQPIADQMVQGMGLPTELPKAQLALLLGGVDLGPAAETLLPTLLEQLPDTVPLGYYYDYEGTYWVDPTTGIIVDTEKRETRTVGLSPDAIGGTALELVPVEQLGALRVPIMDYTYTATDASVEEAKTDAEDAAGTLQLYGMTLPIIGIIAGALLFVLGVVFIVRKPKAA
jgi:hypothetical protein